MSNCVDPGCSPSKRSPAFKIGSCTCNQPAYLASTARYTTAAPTANMHRQPTCAYSHSALTTNMNLNAPTLTTEIGWLHTNILCCILGPKAPLALSML